VNTNISKEQIVEFVKAKTAERERIIQFRDDSEACWRGGTDESWRAVGCKLSKRERLEAAAIHGIIAVKNRRELELWKALLEIVTSAKEVAAL